MNEEKKSIKDWLRDLWKWMRAHPYKTIATVLQVLTGAWLLSEITENNHLKDELLEARKEYMGVLIRNSVYEELYTHAIHDYAEKNDIEVTDF